MVNEADPRYTLLSVRVLARDIVGARGPSDVASNLKVDETPELVKPAGSVQVEAKDVAVWELGPV